MRLYVSSLDHSSYCSFHKVEVFFVGVLGIRAPLFEVHIKALDFLEIPTSQRVAVPTQGGPPQADSQRNAKLSLWIVKEHRATGPSCESNSLRHARRSHPVIGHSTGGHLVRDLRHAPNLHEEPLVICGDLHRDHYHTGSVQASYTRCHTTNQVWIRV